MHVILPYAIPLCILQSYFPIVCYFIPFPFDSILSYPVLFYSLLFRYVREGTFFIGGGGGGGGMGWGFLGVLSFLNSWPSPLEQQKKSMTLHKRWPKNVWPSLSPLNPSWYHWSLLTGCLPIVRHCHNTEVKRWISLSICDKTILKCSAGDPSNKYYIRIFCQGAHLCQFQFWKKMLWRWPDVLKSVVNAQLVLRVSCPNWERFVRNW